MESQNTVAGAIDDANEAAQPENTGRAKLQTLADVFANVDADKATAGADDNEDGDAGGDAQKKAKPKKFNDLAGATGLELGELYKLEIASGSDGSPITIENLKDLHATQEAFALRELQFEETRQQRESELLQAQDELRELMAALPEKAIKPEAIEKMRAKQAQVQSIERARTLAAIPEWNDADVRTKDLQGMAEHLQSYGFPPNYLQTAFSARTMKYVRDNWQREQRIKKALALVTSGKPPTATKSKPAGGAPKKHPVPSKTNRKNPNRLEQLFSELK